MQRTSMSMSTTTSCYKLLSPSSALTRYSPSQLHSLQHPSCGTGVDPGFHCCMPLQHIEVNKLIKARPLDNIEFMQWMKSYFDSHCNGQNLNYDAAARRANSKTGGVKGSSGKPRVPLSSAATTANVNSSTTPAKSNPASKKAPGTRQFGQAVIPNQPAAPDTAMAAQVQEAAEQVCF